MILLDVFLKFSFNNIQFTKLHNYVAGGYKLKVDVIIVLQAATVTEFWLEREITYSSIIIHAFEKWRFKEPGLGLMPCMSRGVDAMHITWF